MKLWKRLLILKLCFKIVLMSLIVPINAYAFDPVAQPDRVTRAVSGVLLDGMRSRGFTANDPRVYNTLTRISPQIAGVAGTAAAITAGAVTAPAWASVALAVGVGAVVSYAVTLGLDALVQWFFRTDGRIDESSASTTSNPNCELTAGGPYWGITVSAGGVARSFYGCDAASVAREGYSYYVSDKPSSPREPTTCGLNQSANSYDCGLTVFRQAAGAPNTCPAGTFSNGTSCLGFTHTITPVQPAQAVTPATESPRFLRRLQLLRRWSYEQVEQVLTRGA